MFKFNPEDFIHDNVDFNVAFYAAEVANAKLKEWLDEAETHYESPEDGNWCPFPYSTSKFKAKLVCIEEIKDENE